MQFRYAAVAALVAGLGSGQALVGLATQSKNVDFTGASTTKPFKSGTTLPATCAIGETFFKTNAPAGSNFYACTAQNTWTLQAASLAGDVSGAASTNVVGQIQGRPVPSSAPASGQALV